MTPGHEEQAARITLVGPASRSVGRFVRLCSGACATADLDAVAIGGLTDEEIVVSRANHDVLAHCVAAVEADSSGVALCHPCRHPVRDLRHCALPATRPAMRTSPNGATSAVGLSTATSVRCLTTVPPCQIDVTSPAGWLPVRNTWCRTSERKDQNDGGLSRTDAFDWLT